MCLVLSWRWRREERWFAALSVLRWDLGNNDGMAGTDTGLQSMRMVWVR